MKRTAGILSTVLLLSAAGSVTGQKVTGAQDTGSNERADRLKEAAEALYDQAHRLHRAAELHEQEAAQRADMDPRKVDALDRAARLYAYAGDADRAHQLMAKAAHQALRRGDVRRAAHAYVDAAFMARRMSDARLAREMMTEAELLTQSPLLTESDRLGILRRIDPARAQSRAFDS